ncbi:hybrid sensor histidine kinase/response regulator [Leptolyngbya sp. AN02str]|uniref:hybrid sensor histidine kinase/response regulator n=1 Tax=Leptolyngbya sp. AN02str TaxID=3423363 RepID=UPI003D313B41
MDSQATILIIDDEPDNFDVIEAYLDQADYQLSYVSNGQQAFDLLKSFQPDVILLDVMMPVMNGIEFCQKFKASTQWRHIPIIIVTALTASEDLARCLAAGADDFISKPVNRLELRARLSSMLRIKRHYDNLQAVLRMREDMVNMVVHDLRNPLASITLAADLLQRPNFPPERQAVKVKQIALAGKELQAMIDTLLLMAKLEAGKLILDIVSVDLNALCLSALEAFDAIANQKNVQLCSQLANLDCMVAVDQALFRRIIDNLLSNAIKFSPTNSQVYLSTESLTTEKIRIKVTDQGTGVTEEMRQTIFERYEIGTFIQGVNQTGLGLAFCKLAIEAHGGEIMVENNQPNGAIFMIDMLTSAV